MSNLRIENVSVTLGGKQILKDVGFHVAAGEVVGLIGPNGAGKSTILRSVLGLVEVDHGRISIGRDDLNFIPRRERAKRMAYLPQGAPVHWPLTAERAVALGRIPHLNPWQDMSAADEAAVTEALHKTDSLAFRERLVTTLSGGERSRVMLARALVVGANFLLADEPTASLDPMHQLQVMNILKAEAEAGTGVVVVMHDLSQAARYCDRLVLMQEGSVVAEGSPQEVLTDATIRAVFGVEVARHPNAANTYLIPDKLVE